MNTFDMIVLIGVVLAGFVQGISGFGFGLVAMSLWAWTIDPKIAAVLAVFGAMTGQIISAFTIKRKVDVKRLIPLLLGGFIGIKLGINALNYVDTTLFKALFGLTLIVLCPLMLLTEHLSNITIKHRFFEYLSSLIVGILGGISGTLGGFTGVIPTLWFTFRGFKKDEQRSLIQNFNLIVLTVTFSSFVYEGKVNVNETPLYLFLMIPFAMFIPSYLGSKVYQRISQVTFKRIILSLLTLSGLTLLMSSWHRLLTVF